MKPNGVLVSTDYWHEPIDTHGKEMYGVPVHIFTRAELEQASQNLWRIRVRPISPLDLVCNEKAAIWRDAGLDYTFVIFTLKKLPKRMNWLQFNLIRRPDFFGWSNVEYNPAPSAYTVPSEISGCSDAHLAFRIVSTGLSARLMMAVPGD